LIEATAICERLIGTIRRECLNWLIPLSEAHLRRVLRLWVEHYRPGRPHMALGPDVPEPAPAESHIQSETRSRQSGNGGHMAPKYAQE